jgi:hypothetical protein
MGKYHQQMNAKRAATGGAAVTGLSEGALVEHICLVVPKLMEKHNLGVLGGAPAGAGGMGAGGGGAPVTSAAQAAARQQQHMQQQQQMQQQQPRKQQQQQQQQQHMQPTQQQQQQQQLTPQQEQQQQMQQRIAAAGAEAMAAYWRRLGELRGAYLPRLRQTFELAKKKASGSNNNKKAEQFLQWMSVTLIPMLQQTEGSPFGLAKFLPEELNSLVRRLYKLWGLYKLDPHSLKAPGFNP